MNSTCMDEGAPPPVLSLLLNSVVVPCTVLMSNAMYQIFVLSLGIRSTEYRRHNKLIPVFGPAGVSQRRTPASSIKVSSQVPSLDAKRLCTGPPPRSRVALQEFWRSMCAGFCCSKVPTESFLALRHNASKCALRSCGSVKSAKSRISPPRYPE